jgi:hypothetical protein
VLLGVALGGVDSRGNCYKQSKRGGAADSTLQGPTVLDDGCLPSTRLDWLVESMFQRARDAGEACSDVNKAKVACTVHANSKRQAKAGMVSLTETRGRMGERAALTAFISEICHGRVENFEECAAIVCCSWSASWIGGVSVRLVVGKYAINMHATRGVVAEWNDEGGN